MARVQDAKIAIHPRVAVPARARDAVSGALVRARIASEARYRGEANPALFAKGPERTIASIATGQVVAATAEERARNGAELEQHRLSASDSAIYGQMFFNVDAR